MIFFKKVSIFIFSALIFSCATTKTEKTPEEEIEETQKYFEDGVYSYDFQRVTENVQTESFYRSAGVKYSQMMEKTQSGSCTVLKNRAFKIPELEDWILISEDGTISSPTNPTIFGKATSDGRIFWSGEFVIFDQASRISERALLLPAPENLRAPRSLDGSYQTKAGNWEISFDLVDGIAKSDFGTFIVDEKGEFGSKFKIVLMQEMNGEKSAATTAQFDAKGKIESDGSLVYRVFSDSASKIDSEEKSEVYTGTRISQRVQSDESFGDFEIPEKIGIDQNAPEWFSHQIFEKDGRIFACSRQTAENRATAKQIAIAQALAEIASFKAISIQAETETKIADFGENSATFKDSILAQAKLSGEYSVENEFFDSQRRYAYICISVKSE